jgi:hypothetical protein
MESSKERGGRVKKLAIWQKGENERGRWERRKSRFDFVVEISEGGEGEGKMKEEKEYESDFLRFDYDSTPDLSQ